jgi:hypothetical protein
MNKSICRAFALIALLAISALQLHAQGKGQESADNAVPNSVIPPSPEGASLGKYGDIPVSLFKGMPNVSIPIYTIKKGGISVPISLNYNSAGNKVNEIATNVGLGWTLFAGGAITISINDKGDFRYSRNPPINVKTFDPNYFDPNAQTLSPDYVFARNYIKGTALYDLQPDDYYYNLGGESGKFFLDTDNTVGYTVPKNDFSITHDSQGWRIIDTKGTIYNFARTELSSVSDSSITGNPRSGDTPPTVSTIYLTQIKDSKGNVVNFEYTNSNYKYLSGCEETQYLLVPQGGCSAINPSKSYKIQTIAGSRLRRISTPDNSVEVLFNYESTEREDLEHLNSVADSVNALKQIVIRTSGSPIKTYNLVHDYFRSADYSASAPKSDKALKSRLKLTSVNQTGMPPYTFVYETGVNLPARGSFSSDYWGYYNGTNGTTSIPTNPTYSFTGANRDPNPAFTQANILKKVIYPTGGSSTLNYQQNVYAGYQTVQLDSTSSHPFNAAAGKFKTFTLTLTESHFCTITYNLNGGGHDQSSATITGPNGYNLSLSGAGSLTSQGLDAGTYTISIDNAGGINTVNLNISWVVNYSNYQFVTTNAGGVRVWQTVDQADPSSPVVKKFYRYNADGSDTGKTSSLVGPTFSPTNFAKKYTQRNFNAQGAESDCVYNVLYSNPPPLLGRGSPDRYGYRTVTVLTDSLGLQGKSINTFTTSFNDFVDTASNSLFIDRSWGRGLLLQQSQLRYNNASQQYGVVRRTKNQYWLNLSNNFIWDNSNSAIPANQHTVFGIQLLETSPEKQITTGQLLATFAVEKFPVASAWFYANQNEETQYDPSDTTKFSKTTTNYYYDNPTHLQQTRTTTTNSDGKVRTNIVTYAQDYASGTAFLEDMKTNHLTGLPVEQVEYITDGTQTNVSSGSVTEYKSGGTGEADRVLNFESTAPVAIGSFKFSDRATGVLPYGTAPAGYGLDSRYQEKAKYNYYDGVGNPLMVTQSNGIAISYIWDYQSTYPVAAVKNSDTVSIAYTSFESNGTGRWLIGSTQRDGTTAAFSGNKSYNLSNGNITKSSLTAANTYIVSYWTKNASPLTITGTTSGYPIKGTTLNGWTYYEHQVTGQTTITVSGTGNIDELRLYPKGAQMTTYTYSPLVGITSSVDAKNSPIYYEYDGLQRLINIKDKDGNIVKHFDYHYSGQ